MTRLRAMIDRVNRSAQGQSSFLWEFIGVNLVVGYIWFFAGYEKLTGGVFAPGLAKTLAYFASKNPHGWYVSYLNGTAIPYASLLAQCVQWGEFLGGSMLLIGVFAYFLSASNKVKYWVRIGMIAAFAGLCLMNANFYFAAGWTSASTSEVNVIMFWLELIMLGSWIEMKVKK